MNRLGEREVTQKAALSVAASALPGFPVVLSIVPSTDMSMHLSWVRPCRMGGAAERPETEAWSSLCFSPPSPLHSASPGNFWIL